MKSELMVQLSQHRAASFTPASASFTPLKQRAPSKQDSIAAHPSSVVPSTVRGVSATASVKGRFALIQSVVKHDPIPT